MNISSGSIPTSPAPHPPAINFATEWLDEDGYVCPKNVDYATQCPKGHALVPLDGGGVPQAQQTSGADSEVMCRVCHASTPHQHACDWLVCSVAGCCGGYSVCAECASALARADAAVAVADDFPLEVRCTQAALLLLRCV